MCVLKQRLRLIFKSLFIFRLFYVVVWFFSNIVFQKHLFYYYIAMAPLFKIVCSVLVNPVLIFVFCTLFHTFILKPTPHCLDYFNFIVSPILQPYTIRLASLQTYDSPIHSHSFLDYQVTLNR
jgi:hypothetical protein